MVSARSVGTGSTSRTVDVIQDFLETLVLPNLFNNFRYRVCGQHQHLLPRTGKNQHILKTTPMTVNMISCEITKNAKYRARTARSKRDCVKAPWYRESQRIMRGKKNPKKAETAGGSTPETMLK